MNAQQVKEYRASIELQLKEKENDIENTVSYITIGLLGLFLTINESFIPFSNSIYRFLLFISVFLFLLSFLIGLVNKFKTTKFDREILDILDNTDLSNSDGEQALLSKWSRSDKTLQNNRKFIYLFLFLAVVIQQFYFFCNLNVVRPKEEKVSVEFILPLSDTTINLNDTSIKVYKFKDIAK